MTSPIAPAIASPDADRREPRTIAASRLLRVAQALLAADRHPASHALEAAARLLEQVDRADAPGAATTGGLAAWQALRVTRYVEAHLQERIRLRQLADEARLSVRHFARAFRTSFGCTALEYVTDRRLTVAQAMMRDTDLPLSEVAVACGLSDQAHLSRLFRRRTGLTPLAWRRRHQGAPA